MIKNICSFIFIFIFINFQKSNLIIIRYQVLQKILRNVYLPSLCVDVTILSMPILAARLSRIKFCIWEYFLSLRVRSSFEWNFELVKIKICKLKLIDFFIFLYQLCYTKEKYILKKCKRYIKVFKMWWQNIWKFW